MVAIRIRQAQISDAERLADIGFRAWESGILPILPDRPGLRENERRRLEQAASDQLERIIVAEVDGVLGGWCSRSARGAYIPYLLVAPEFQGMGLGSALLQRMEAMLELRGATRVQLETPADNLSAVRFYQRQGYRILAMRADGSGTHEALMSVHLEKMLRPFAGDVGDD